MQPIKNTSVSKIYYHSSSTINSKEGRIMSSLIIYRIGLSSSMFIKEKAASLSIINFTIWSKEMCL